MEFDLHKIGHNFIRTGFQMIEDGARKGVKGDITRGIDTMALGKKCLETAKTRGNLVSDGGKRINNIRELLD